MTPTARATFAFFALVVLFPGTGTVAAESAEPGITVEEFRAQYVPEARNGTIGPLGLHAEVRFRVDGLADVNASHVTVLLDDVPSPRVLLVLMSDGGFTLRVDLDGDLDAGIPPLEPGAHRLTLRVVNATGHAVNATLPLDVVPLALDTDAFPVPREALPAYARVGGSPFVPMRLARSAPNESVSGRVLGVPPGSNLTLTVHASDGTHGSRIARPDDGFIAYPRDVLQARDADLVTVAVSVDRVLNGTFLVGGSAVVVPVSAGAARVTSVRVHEDAGDVAFTVSGASASEQGRVVLLHGSRLIAEGPLHGDAARSGDAHARVPLDRVRDAQTSQYAVLAFLEDAAGRLVDFVRATRGVRVDAEDAALQTADQAALRVNVHNLNANGDAIPDAGLEATVRLAADGLPGAEGPVRGEITLAESASGEALLPVPAPREPGTYTVRVTAFMGELSVIETVTVTVHAAVSAIEHALRSIPTTPLLAGAAVASAVAVHLRRLVAR